jgi:hypothetical protein
MSQMTIRRPFGELDLYDQLIQTPLFFDSLVLSWKYGNKEMSCDGC